MAPPTRSFRHHNTVNIDKSGVAGAEPEIIGGIVIRRLIEGDDEGGGADMPGEEGFFHQMGEALGIGEGEFLRVLVVKGAQGGEVGARGG